MISCRRRTACPAGYINIAQPAYQATNFTMIAREYPGSSEPFCSCQILPGQEFKQRLAFRAGVCFLSLIALFGSLLLRVSCSPSLSETFAPISPQPKSYAICAGQPGKRSDRISHRLSCALVASPAFARISLHEKWGLTENQRLLVQALMPHASYRHSSINTLLL